MFDDISRKICCILFEESFDVLSHGIGTHKTLMCG